MPNFRLMKGEGRACEDVNARDVDGAIVEFGRRLGLPLTSIGDGKSPYFLLPLDHLPTSSATNWLEHSQPIYFAKAD